MVHSNSSGLVVTTLDLQEYVPYTIYYAPYSTPYNTYHIVSTILPYKALPELSNSARALRLPRASALGATRQQVEAFSGRRQVAGVLCGVPDYDYVYYVCISTHTYSYKHSFIDIYIYTYCVYVRF